MKIICIGRNYADHAKELGNAVPEEPVFFCKPDSAILAKGNPFFIPEWTSDIHYEIELVLRISRLGKSIQPEFAHRYYDAISVGIDFTARDVQEKLKAKGLPWEKAKGFDGSAVVPQEWIPIHEVPRDEHGHILFSLQKNGETVQNGNSADMIFSFDHIVAHVSKFMTLRIGDLIFTGTPKGVGPVSMGDTLEGFLGSQSQFKLNIR
jgi:acylpyruvate hydrolase